MKIFNIYGSLVIWNWIMMEMRQMQILNGYKNVLVGNRIDIKQDIKEIRYNFKPVSLNW